MAVPPVVHSSATDHDWRFGVAGGAGVEYMWTSNWTLRGEFLFLDFLDKQQVFTPQFPFPFTTCSFGAACRETFANTAEVLRVGVNYKFP